MKPFVCTEYQGKRGTFAVMGDGKVRFIPETIDPKIFRTLCLIVGGKVDDLDKIAPVVAGEGQPELKAQGADRRRAAARGAAAHGQEVGRPSCCVACGAAWRKGHR